MLYQAATLLALAASTTLAHPTSIVRRQNASNGKSSKQGITVSGEGFSSAIQNYPKASWIHNWNYKPSANSNVPQGIEYVPELQGKSVAYGIWNNQPPTDPECATFRATVKNADHVLSINEPDIPGYGTNQMSAQDAAVLHSKCLNGLQKPQIGSPSVSSSVDTGGSYNYLDDWVTACKNLPGNVGCDWDFMSVHYEGTLDTFGWFSKTYMPGVMSWAKAHNKPVWLTEFRCKDADAGQRDQCLSQLVNWLEDSDVERYAAYLIDDATSQNVGGSTAAAYSSVQ
ncbi:MAG: hypothetical protein Q9160_006811 [Pyrenula sp. 1 TL-2023]